MKIWNIMKKYLLKYILITSLFFFISIIAWGLSLITPYISGKYLDYLVNLKEIDVLYSLITIFVIASILEIIVSYFKNILIIRLQNLVSFELNFDIINHVKKLPIKWFENTNSAYLNQRINSDSNVLSSFVIYNLVEFFLNIISIIALLTIILKFNFKILTLLFLFIPIYIIAYIYLKRPLYSKSFKYKEEQSEFFSTMNMQFDNIKLIKLNSWFDIFSENLKLKFDLLIDAINSYAKIAYLFNNIDLSISRLANAVLFIYGGIEVINTRLTIGEFTIIRSYFTMILSSVGYFLKLGKDYQQALVSYNRINEILESKIENNGVNKLKNIERISIENISFSYDKNKVIFNNFNYKFEKGKIYTIIGQNGSGKSTLINMILGINSDYSGIIKYNNTDIKNIDLYYMRKKYIGSTEQEPALINCSILENITMGLSAFNEIELENLLEVFNLNNLVNSLENGIYTNINEKSTNLSGGEKQKISLIRTILKSPDVIILDEPTSALDTKSLDNFKFFINSIKHEKIIILITHNDVLAGIADDVLRIPTYENAQSTL